MSRITHGIVILRREAARELALPLSSPMILFDAVHVNRSGGEVLLDVLIDALRPHQEGIHFLLDDRLTGKFDAHGLAHVIYLKASVLQRHRFY